MGYINLLLLKLLLVISLVVLLANGNGTKTEKQPEFLTPLRNQTVRQGFPAMFSCVVNNLGKYNVAWIKVDKQAIIAIGEHKVTDNKRISVIYDGKHKWHLSIRNVQPSDIGGYMCQMNTDPVQYQVAYLYVVPTPEKMNNSRETEVANEGGNDQLIYPATGLPEPTV